MSNWSIKIKEGFSSKNPVFIEGLPGIGNVGKIAVDYLADFLEAEKVVDFFSFDMPAHVFIGEDNLAIPPTLALFYKKVNDVDYIFLRGEYQPNSDRATYEFTDLLLSTLKKWGCTQVIATGGIGLTEFPSQPEVFVTGSSKDFCETFTKVGANENVFGLVGPIIGVSGLLVGLSKGKNIDSVALLVETFIHPDHISLQESRVMADLLSKRFDFKIDFAEFDEEIKYIQNELDAIEDGIDISSDKKSSKYKKLIKGKDLNYIG